MPAGDLPAGFYGDSMPTFLMLRPGNPATFRRTVERDAKGQSVRKIEFPPLTPVAVSDDDYFALESDIGPILALAAIDEHGKPLPKVAKNQNDPGQPKRKKK